MHKRKLITIHGKVQGVGFRYAARIMAQYMDIKGFVKNKPDGTVFIDAEGEEERLREFITWCHKGPDHAKVSEVIEMEIQIQHYKSFEVNF
jgi:acylphosphatase